MILILLLSNQAVSKIRNVDYARVKKINSSINDVCFKLTKKKEILNRAHDLVKVDCMGTIYKVQEFCKIEHKENPFLVRGYIDQERNEVSCVFSRQAIVKWECPTMGQFNCQTDAKNECEKLKSIYAVSLNTFRSFYENVGADKVLNCFYNKDSETLKL